MESIHVGDLGVRKHEDCGQMQKESARSCVTGELLYQDEQIVASFGHQQFSKVSNMRDVLHGKNHIM